MSAKTTAATTAPGPLHHAPRRIRPPFDADTYLPADHQRADETPDQWRARTQADTVAALLEPLAGIELGPYDHKILGWLADWDIDTVGTIASLLYRARAAGPIGGGR